MAFRRVLFRSVILEVAQTNETETNETSVEICGEEVEQKEFVANEVANKTKKELVSLLESLLAEPIEGVRERVSQIKHAFYLLRNEEIKNEKQEFLDKGNEESAFAVIDDAEELEFKEILKKLKDKRTEFNAQQEAVRLENLETKQAVLSSMDASI